MNSEQSSGTARRYQWYVKYDREDEYDKNPQWAVDMKSKVVDEETEDYERDTVRFYDKYDPNHMYIESDVTVDLTDTL